MEFSKKIEIFKIVQRFLMVILTAALLFIMNQARIEMNNIYKELHNVADGVEKVNITVNQYASQFLTQTEKFNLEFEKISKKISKCWFL